MTAKQSANSQLLPPASDVSLDTLVTVVAVGILAGIMKFVIPAFKKMFEETGIELPPMTEMLIWFSNLVTDYWYLIPGIPISIWLFVKLVCKFSAGRYGWHLFLIQMPLFGQLVEKNIVARTMRTLGTLVTSGVPILEALQITKETSGNAVFEKLFSKTNDAIREGETISQPLKDYAKPGFHPVALFWFTFFIPLVGALIYMMKFNARVIDDMVVNMVDVGEETGELDTMLYKVADTYDEEVAVLTDGLMALMEPLLIIVLGVAVGFIVIALFLPLIKLISSLS